VLLLLPSASALCVNATLSDGAGASIPTNVQ
jgi:hypothetical protein